MRTAIGLRREARAPVLAIEFQIARARRSAQVAIGAEKAEGDDGEGEKDEGFAARPAELEVGVEDGGSLQALLGWLEEKLEDEGLTLETMARRVATSVRSLSRRTSPQAYWRAFRGSPENASRRRRPTKRAKRTKPPASPSRSLAAGTRSLAAAARGAARKERRGAVA